MPKNLDFHMVMKKLNTLFDLPDKNDVVSKIFDHIHSVSLYNKSSLAKIKDIFPQCNPVCNKLT